MAFEGWIGLLGGIIFYLSWIVQTWETKKHKKPTFTAKFFWIRVIGSSLLLIEAIRLNSIGFILVYLGTIGMMGYNLLKLKSYINE